jgi:DNA-binding winged helix-turn-helix (wHTH) protein
LDNIFRFARFEANRQQYQLWCSNRPIKLERLPLELLFLLLENRGKLVTRTQIVGKLWGDNVFLDTERSINTAVRKIRKALEDDSRHPQFVETVVGRGYRFIAAPAPSNPAQDLQHATPSDLEPVVRLHSAHDSSILLRDFLVETSIAGTVLTCDVVVSDVSLGRLKLLDFELPCDLTHPLKPHDRLMLNLQGVRVSLTENAARALQTFSVSVLQKGLRTRTTDSFHLNEQTGKEVTLHLAAQPVMGQQR